MATEAAFRQRRSRPLTRAASSIAIALGAALFVGLACTSGRGDASLESGTPACVEDADCDVGQCHCGLCAVACDGGVQSCSEQANSACFGPGSLPFAVLCGADEPAGICLQLCATDADCARGQQCLLGACLPREREAPGGAVEQRDVPSAAVSLGTIPFDDMGDYASACPLSAPCPTLEQALKLDECVEITVMCGLWRVASIGLGTYWYDGFGAPPLAAQNDRGSGSTISIECERVDLACSTCGMDMPRCDDFPDWLPGPVPQSELVPGCTCESVDAETARVSLECFCSVYACESYAELTADCSVAHLLSPALSTRAHEACGQIWFYERRQGGAGRAFDAASGELVAAEAVSAGPVTLPCGTYRVVAGAPIECEEPAPCVCGLRFDEGGCEGEPWFPSLPY